MLCFRFVFAYLLSMDIYKRNNSHHYLVYFQYFVKILICLHRNLFRMEEIHMMKFQKFKFFHLILELLSHLLLIPKNLHQIC
jgi:hypothetical protein